MSYDLIAFDPAIVDDSGFNAWWAAQDWSDDDAPLKPLIADFALLLQREFPSMHAPGVWDLAERSGDQETLQHLADYSFGNDFVYVNFDWAVADEARRAFLRVAQQCGAAVALVSEGETIVRPVPSSTTEDGRPRELLIEDFIDLGYRSAAHAPSAVSQVLQHRLQQLNGDDFGIYVLEAESAGTRDRLRGAAPPAEYMQSAGSAAAMTVEVKRREDDGVLRQYAIGRRVSDAGNTVISWAGGKRSITVPTTETFTADEALPVYQQWCRDGTVSRTYRLRLLDL
jgi:hypothetical protein